MTFTIKKRRLARTAVALGIVVGVLALGAGIAFAFFSDTSTSQNNLALGTVALNMNDSQSSTCNYSALDPGDLTGSTTCSLSVTYTGSLSAYVSLSVAVQSEAGPGGATLYDGSNSSGLTLSISDGHNTFALPTGAGTTGGSCPAGFTCWSMANDLAASYSGSTPDLTFSSGDTATWTVTPKFSKTAPNAYQGASASLVLTAQAVQAPGNPLPVTCTTSTIGLSCPANGSFAWS